MRKLAGKFSPGCRLGLAYHTGVYLAQMKPYLGLLLQAQSSRGSDRSVLQRGSTKLDPDLYSRVKRLLEIDRARGRNRRSRDPEQTHLLSIALICRGGGTRIVSTAFECFALLTGLRLMAHGWPQSTAVALLRRLRPELGNASCPHSPTRPDRFFLINNSCLPALGLVIWP